MCRTSIADIQCTFTMKSLFFLTTALSLLATPITALALPIADPETLDLQQRDSPLDLGAAATTTIAGAAATTAATSTTPLESNPTLATATEVSTAPASANPSSTSTSSQSSSTWAIVAGSIAGVGVLAFIIGHAYYRKYHPKPPSPPTDQELVECWAQYGNWTVPYPDEFQLRACWQKKGGTYRYSTLSSGNDNSGGGG
jgi:hypothetical protein